MTVHYLGKRRGKHRYITLDDLPLSEIEWAFKAADDSLVLRATHVLDTAFPGYDWKVIVRHYHGYLQIKLEELTDWGPVVKLIDLKGDPMLKKARDAAGEYLEGLKLPRKEVDEDTIREAVYQRMPSLTRGLRPYH